MTTWLANRYSNLSTFNAVAINYSTLTGTTITVTSTMVSLGASTNKVYTALSQGNFTSTSNWVTSLTGRTSTIGVSMSANAQTQLVVSQSSSTTSIQFTSTLGQTWSTLSNATGLPSSLTTSYSAGAISGDGKYGIVGTLGGYVYKTENAGASWTNTNPNTPIIYLPFETAPVNGATIGGTTLTVSPSVPALVPGIVGKTAVNLVNTPAGTATQYIRGSWTNGALTSFTVSLWFNLQSTTTDYSYIFSAFNAALSIVISTNVLSATIPIAASPYYTGVTVPTYQVIALNTWYNVTLSWQAAGSCYMYLNNVLYGSATGAGIFGGTTSNLFALSGFDTGPVNAFNGYVDDLKIYNSAISTTPFSPMIPQNWSNIALSNSGQYMLATATGSGLFLSSNYGSTWTQVTSAMLYAAWTSAQVSATGQYLLANSPVVNVQPQLTGLATNTWQSNGVTWNTSGSSFTSQNWYYRLFNGFPSPYSTAIATATNYSAASPGLYTGSTSTSVIGQGTVNGDYFQIQSSIQLQIQSYTFYSAGYWQFPNTYTIAGSNDGINWFLIQSVTMDRSPFGTNSSGTYATSSSYININQSGTQTMTTSAYSGTLTCTTSSYSVYPYTYFRLIMPTIWNGPATITQAALSQWIINFQAGGQTYSTNYGLTWNAALPLYSMIQPQLTGLASSGTALTTSLWQANGVSWIAKASSLDPNNPATWPVSGPFDGVSATQWNSNIYYNTLGNYTGPNNTTVSGSTVSGEWLQIKSSTPLIIYSYQLGVGTWFQYPKTYTIAGSNDESTWFAIQTVVLASNPFGTTNQIIPFSPIIVNQSSSQTISTSAGSTVATCTAYNSTTPYTYFRLIGTSIIGNGTTQELAIGEFIINFTTGAQTTQSLSPSGLTALNGYIPSTIAPQKTGLTRTTWSQGGVNWIVSASSLYTSDNFLAQYAFNNYSLVQGWVSAFAYSAASPGIYTGSRSTSVMGASPTIVLGEWLQLQSSVPLVMNSYSFNTSGYGQFPNTYTIAGSSNGTDWFLLQSVTMSANPSSTTNYAQGTSYITVNQSGSQTFKTTIVPTGVTFTCTISTYGTTAYSYFRIIIPTVWNGTGIASTLGIAQWFINFTGPANTSLYNVISPLTNFSTGSSIATGIIPGVITGSALSNTGQYMVVVTNNTSGNNVYYSTNTGVIFTGLQLGSLPLTSCAISYDGSYITVSNATTVYQLNNNSSGYSVAVGNQAGAVNQYQNAIAIGNYAGNYYQYSNSIILNASGSALNSANQGFYVAPIAQYTASSSQTFSLLGYGIGTGTDNQVVQSGVTFSSAQQTIYGEWIQYQLATPVSITSYVLQARGSFPDRYPVAWTLVGSADGVNWTILDSQSGKTSTLWGVSYLLPIASPVYSFIRIIFTQVNNISVVNGTGYVDIAGFILYSSGGPIFGSYTGYTTLAAGMYNILLYNSLPVCTITFSRPNTNVLNSFGIAAGATSDGSFPPATMATLNGYTIGSTFLSMYYPLTGSTLEYSPPNYIATRGTSTVVTAPLIQTQDLTGNTKHQSSSLISLDVNGTTRTQQLQFLDGSIQNTANQFQPAWGSFGQLFTWSPMPLSIATQTNVAISASGQYISIVNTIDNASTISISSTYGQSWTTIAVNTKGLGSNKMECVNVSGTGQYQLASCSDIGLVYGSSTYGQTWAPVYTGSIIMRSPGLSYTGQYQTIVPLSGSSNVLISSTYGQSWTPINIGTAAAFAGNVGISYSGQYQVLAVQTGTPGIYTSSTYGQTWSLAYSDSSITGWNYVAISSSGQYQIATVYSGLVYLSINYGQNFAVTSLSLGNWRGCAISSTGQYMACTNDATIAYSTTYGQSWSATTVRATGAFYGLGMSASGQYMIAGGSLIAGGVSAYLSVVPSYSPGTVVIGSGTIATPLGMTLLASTSGFGGYDFKCSTTFTAVAFNSIVDGGNVGYQYIYHDVNVNNGAKYMGFAYNNVLIGTITQLTTTSVAYNTNSDYRLKSNVTPLSNSISRLQQLKPVSYTWTADNIDDIGFIAHEFKEVFPLNVTGEKDEVDEEGKPKYQQMSPNVCIPLLVSCVQEQQTEITYLKTQLASNSTRIETLEAQLSQVLQRLAAANIA